MRFWYMAGLAFFAVLVACQPKAPAVVEIVDGSWLHTVLTDERTPAAILDRAGVAIGAADELLYNGYVVPGDASLPGNGSGTLQIVRAASVSVGGKQMQMSARTVGEVLTEADVQLLAADSISPLASSALTGPVIVNYAAARELTVRVGGQDVRVMSSAPTVGEALAQAGLPLLGLDYSKPGQDEPLPADGQVQIIRVSESVIFAQKPIPFKSEFRQSPDVEFGTQQILQPGLPGLAVSRVRIRYEDGVEVSRQTESETVVRPPQNRLTVQGTKIVVKTATINGVTIQYWLQMPMYATTYSPCESSPCSYGTASGLRAGKGVVAVDPGLYAYLNGQRLFIAGYGQAVIGDIGGGYLVEQMTGVSRYRWIDLGYDDANVGNLTGWVTVYFLAPAPATVPDILK